MCCGWSKGATAGDRALWPEQPAEIGKEAQQGGEIAEREEEQEHEQGADQIHIEGRPLSRRIAAGGTIVVEAADRRVAMWAGLQPRRASQLHFE